ncbi:hypothetical protein WJX73_004876 [Symbiochloris irregularis]|uniref:Uncharacterized protein n=1 Tax=Symbiochloris irregularis TaxID=706552 RepID=A0AAW1PYM4_9CHLO
MTGFTNWLRRVLCLSPRKDLWSLSAPSAENDETPSPADVKIRLENDRQLEVKVVYNIALGLKRQAFKVEVFMFHASELGAVDAGFYHNLWQVVRLHTPEASIASLSHREQCPGSLLAPIAASLAALKQPCKHVRDRGSQEHDACQLMRLQACMFRRATRRATKRVLKQLRSASKEQPPARSNGQMADVDASASSMAIAMVDHLCAAIDSFRQVCAPALEEGTPTAVREVWPLVDEFVLCEAQRSLLKLLRDVDSLHLQRQSVQALSSPQAAAANAESDQQSAEQADESSASASSPQDRSMRPSASMRGIDGASQLGRVWHQASSLREQQGRPIAVHTGQHSTSFGKARKLVLGAIEGLESTRRQSGYPESVIDTSDKFNNERFTNRVSMLKRHAQSAISLKPITQTPSPALADLVGMIVAAIAMGLAVFSVWAAQHWGRRNQWGVIYIAIIIVGYVMKDRLKEWGKRYLQPVAEWFGLAFPNRIIRVEDQRGQVVGRCSETVKVTGPGDVDPKVLRLRDSQCDMSPALRRATRPERVLHYSRTMRVWWRRLDTQVQGVTGLTDVLNFDLRDFCRKMQKPQESHLQLQRTAEGRAHVGQVTCARVYHINIILRIRARSTLSRSKAGGLENKTFLPRVLLQSDLAFMRRLKPMRISSQAYVEKPLVF